jgi:hypothetical protein
MKITSGVLAALLLVTTVAVGQYRPFTEPFPQSANPALANGAAEESSTAVSADMPSSMASQSGTYAERSGKFDLSSPFPQAANPALGRTGDEMSPDTNIDLGSPFPSAANPSSNR